MAKTIILKNVMVELMGFVDHSPSLKATTPFHALWMTLHFWFINRVLAVVAQPLAESRWWSRRLIWVTWPALIYSSTLSMTSCCGRCLWTVNRWHCLCGNKAKGQWLRYAHARNIWVIFGMVFTMWLWI